MLNLISINDKYKQVAYYVQDLETSEKPVGFVSVSHFLQKKQNMSPVFFPDSAPAQDCTGSNVIQTCFRG